MGYFANRQTAFTIIGSGKVLNHLSSTQLKVNMWDEYGSWLLPHKGLAQIQKSDWVVSFLCFVKTVSCENPLEGFDFKS